MREAMRQTFEDESIDSSDYLETELTDGVLQLLFVSEEMDRCPLIAMGYEQTMTLIRFLTEAAKYIHKTH